MEVFLNESSPRTSDWFKSLLISKQVDSGIAKQNIFIKRLLNRQSFRTVLLHESLEYIALPYLVMLLYMD
ncbi:hypothetical protein BWI96_20125 [Siphonobacter sp. SORGH_AS_0500]|nr:hypothetical protein BWI96_20125 [Siphonobacter sp. SORGH_AS_0500]